MDNYYDFLFAKSLFFAVAETCHTILYLYIITTAITVSFYLFIYLFKKSIALIFTDVYTKRKYNVKGAVNWATQCKGLVRH